MQEQKVADKLVGYITIIDFDNLTFWSKKPKIYKSKIRFDKKNFVNYISFGGGFRKNKIAITQSDLKNPIWIIYKKHAYKLGEDEFIPIGHYDFEFVQNLMNQKLVSEIFTGQWDYLLYLIIGAVLGGLAGFGFGFYYVSNQVHTAGKILLDLILSIIPW